MSRGYDFHSRWILMSYFWLHLCEKFLRRIVWRLILLLSLVCAYVEGLEMPILMSFRQSSK